MVSLGKVNQQMACMKNNRKTNTRCECRNDSVKFNLCLSKGFSEGKVYKRTEVLHWNQWKFKICGCENATGSVTCGTVRLSFFWTLGNVCLVAKSYCFRFFLTKLQYRNAISNHLWHFFPMFLYYCIIKLFLISLKCYQDSVNRIKLAGVILQWYSCSILFCLGL